MITVVFRYDDYSALSDAETDVRVIQAFGESGFCCVFGIVPFIVAGDRKDAKPQDLIPLNSVKTEIIRRGIASGAVEPALHGYSHQTVGPGRPFSEFSGIEYEDQLAKIGEGKRFLERNLSVKINLFIPPWNNFDHNTLRALETLGFECISPSVGSGEATSDLGLKVLPATCELPQLRKAIEFGRRSADPEVIVCALFHDYELRPRDPKSGLGVNELIDFLGWLSSQTDVKVRAASEAISVSQDLSTKRFMDNRGLSKRFYSISPPGFAALDSKVYLSCPGVERWRYKYRLSVPFFYFAVTTSSGALSYATVVLISSLAPGLTTAARFGLPAALVASVVYCFRDKTPGFRDLILLTVLLGFCIGVWFA